MMTDRDLLILASRAAGLGFTGANYAEPGEFDDGWGMVAYIHKFWNPLREATRRAITQRAADRSGS